ncbi:MAG: hypothetical protein M0Z88_04015 [Actinomycetota bacterium]|nr:hypothetical protein [Actinomycetota bacterium]
MSWKGAAIYVVAAIAVVVITRWVHRAMTLYPGIPLWVALEVEVGTTLRDTGARLVRAGGRRLAEEQA